MQLGQQGITMSLLIKGEDNCKATLVKLHCHVVKMMLAAYRALDLGAAGGAPLHITPEFISRRGSNLWEPHPLRFSFPQRVRV
jgi:hypothetical protein